MITTQVLAASLTLAALLGSAAWAGAGHPGDENLAGRPGDSKNVVRTVRLVASEIKFDVNKLSFKTGDTIRFVLINKGEQDHELTIGDAAFQSDHRKEMEKMATMAHGDMKGGDMKEMRGHDHAAGSAVTVKPGESRELVWQFTRKGTFEFDCNFPGHTEAGMAGTITVS